MQRVNSYFKTISETTECQSWLNQESYQIDFFQFLYMCATEIHGMHAGSFKKLSKIMKEKSKKMPRSLTDEDFQQEKSYVCKFNKRRTDKKWKEVKEELK